MINMMTKMIDPPSGWRYGFPKEIPQSVLDSGKVLKWLSENGYPQSEIDVFKDKDGEYPYFVYRIFEKEETEKFIPLTEKEIFFGNNKMPETKGLKSGELQKTKNGWVIAHNIIDPYGQIPHPLPLHPNIQIDDDNKNGEKVNFEVVYEYYAKIKNPELKSLEQHNAERMYWIPDYSVPQKQKNGIACPDCGEELYDSNPMVTLASLPAKKNIKCDNCNYSGYRIA